MRYIMRGVFHIEISNYLAALAVNAFYHPGDFIVT